jgi:glycosyltransferase involved in cell wall biosynthesis
MSQLGHGGRSLRIAQVAPLHESVPPRLYGGTERVVSYLTEELVSLGHEVTLFASGDSESSARLVAACPRALRLGGGGDPIPAYFAMFEEVYRRRDEFDVIHFHTDYLHFPVARREPTRHVTTLHSRLDRADRIPLYQRFGDEPVISISDAQRAPLPTLAWCGTVYNGLPLDRYRFAPERGSYLVFLGRLSREKGVEDAIEIAARAGLRLRIAAKVGAADVAYVDEVLRPLLRRPHVEFLGEIDDHEKQELLGGALALLFPIVWPEPFGMVMIEALACGTPVIAYRAGAVTEILDDGVTGVVCERVEDAVRGLETLSALTREACRSAFERRFTSERMARDYVAIYRRLDDARRDHPDRGPVLHPGHEHSTG